MGCLLRARRWAKGRAPRAPGTYEQPCESLCSSVQASTLWATARVLFNLIAARPAEWVSRELPRESVMGKQMTCDVYGGGDDAPSEVGVAEKVSQGRRLIQV